MFVDSHIHLSRRKYDNEFPCVVSEKEQERIVYLNRDKLIDKMKAEGVGFVVEPAVEFESNEQILKLADRYPGYIYPAVGIHPTRVYRTSFKKRKELEKLSGDKKIAAIGELGLDYHYERKEQHRLKQFMWFIWQLELANKCRLPLILHIRLADDDAIKILRLFKGKIYGGVCHCFCRDYKYAKIYTEELGFYLGIGGALLQNNNEALADAVRQTPLEYLLLETDGPYVKGEKPEGITKRAWHNARNTSLIIPDIAAKIAEIKGIDKETVESVTTENAKKLFGVQS